MDETILIRYIVDTTDMVRGINQATALGKSFANANVATNGQLNGSYQQIAETLLNQNVPVFEAFNNSIADQNDKLKENRTRFDMNALSWMFGGMALQRMGLSLTRFMIPSMEKLEKLNTTGAKKVMGITAAFEFLKISLFETLTSLPWFNQFIELIIKGAIWASEFAQQHPGIVGIATAIAGIMVALGTLAMGIGIFWQLEHLAKLLGYGLSGPTGTGIYAAITSIGGALSALSLPALIAAGILALILLAMGLAFWFKETREELKKIWSEGGGKSLEMLIDSVKELSVINIGLIGLFQGIAIGGVYAFAIVNLAVIELIKFISILLKSLELLYNIMSSNPLKGDNPFKTLKEDLTDISETTAKLNQISFNSAKVFTESPGQMYDRLFKSEDLQQLNLGLENTSELTENIGTAAMNTFLGEGGVNPSLETMGELIQEDNKHFNLLKADIENWSAKDTLKTIRVRYVYENTNSDTGGMFGRARDLVSSITG